MIRKALDSIKKEFDENCKRVEKEEYGEERVFLKGKGKGYFHSLAILESLEAEQPQLNENQQVVYDLIAKEIEKTKMGKFYELIKNIDVITFEPGMFLDEIEDAIVELSDKELLEVFKKSIDDLLKGEAHEHRHTH